MFLDFQKIKQLCTLEQVATWLGLETKNGRCQCPVNEGDKRELVLTYDKGVWTCFGCKKKHPGRKSGGDQIELVAHVLQVDQKQAAQHIQTRFHGYMPDKRGLTTEVADKIMDEMEYEHPAVQALGLTAERAEQLGIGFRKRGTKANMVLIPIRDPAGNLLDFAGYSVEKGLVFSKRMGQ